MSTATRVIKNTTWLYAKMGIAMFISLWTTRLILNSLGESDFGIFNLTGGAIAMLGFLNACLAGATQRFISYAEGEGDFEKIKRVFNVGIVLHAGMALIVGLALAVFGLFFFNGIINVPTDRYIAAIVVYISLILSTMFTIATVPYDAILNAHENMKYYAFVGILESILKLVVAILVVYSIYDKLIVYGILMAAIPFITMTIMRGYCHKHYSECLIATRKYWDLGLVKEMASYSGWSLFDALTGIVGTNSLSIILNNFFGTLLNAAQGVANQVGGQLASFSRSMIKAITPVITKSEGAGSRDSMLYYSIIGSKYAYLLLAFFAVPFMLEAPYILKLWLNTVPEWAVLFCQLQLVNTLFSQLTVNLWSAVAATGDVKNFYISKSVMNIMPLFLTWICFSFHMPPYWMYIVAILCNGLINGIVIVYFTVVKCALKIRYFFIGALYPVLFITACSFALGVITLYTMEQSFLRLIVTILLTSIGFGISYLISNSKKEKEAVQAAVVKIFHRK